MVRRYVLAALAQGIAAGDEDVARRALRKIDAVVRGMARRRLERSLIDAALAAHQFNSPDYEVSRHIQRVAALQVAGVEVDATEPTRVSDAYAKLPQVHMPTVPVATISLALVLALLFTGAFVYVASLPGAASRTYKKPLPPPAAGAYKDGGVPLRDEALEKMLVENFTQLVLEVDADRRSTRDTPERIEHMATLREAPPIVSRGPALAKAWGAMLDELERWVHRPISGEALEISQAFRAKVRAVSDELAALGIGYYLEGDIVHFSGGNATAIIYCYRVEEVVFVFANKQPRRVLSLRRLDRLNLYKALLGMQSGELGDPVLLLDQIDDHVSTKLLPVLAPDAVYALADDEYMATDEGAAIAKLAGDTVRRELLVALGADAAAASRVASLLAERHVIVEDWREELENDNRWMPRVDDLFVPETLLDSLDGIVQPTQLRRVRDIDEELARLGAPRIASLCHDLLAATVRRHEAQHGIDEDRPTPLRYPRVLEDLLGPEHNTAGEPRRIVESARLELAAYLSQLANDPRTPQLTLWNLSRFAFMQDHWGTRESYAAVVIAEGLARQLAMASSSPVIHSGTIDRARLAAIMRGLAAIPADRLRTAARALWTELYDEPLVDIVDR